jgi:hypothetical protein
MNKYSKDFDIIGRGLMETFLGMQVKQSKSTARLHLDNYIRELLDEYKAYAQKSLRPKRIPIQPGLILTQEDSPIAPEKRKQKFYRSFVAKLQIAASWVRFDISYAVTQLARFCASAGSTRWAALHHLMEYLEHVPSFKLTYRRRSERSNGLSGYCDSDWANSVSRRSTTGNLFHYNGTPISWRSKLQKTISLSTAEAEYYSVSSAAVEVIYLRYLLKNMGVAPKKWTPVYEDNNNACIEWGNNVIGGRERAKHVDILKEALHPLAIQNGHLRLVRVNTSEQLADIFTKGLHHHQRENCVSAILNGGRKGRRSSRGESR